jgi:polysaccharide biosynthesis protein PslH
MRILYLSPRNFWPLTSGGHLRDYYLLRETARYASVSFLGIRSPHENLTPSTTDCASKLRLEKFAVVDKDASYTAWKIFRGFTGPTPLVVLNYFSPNIARELSRILSEQTFDLVQIEQIQLMGYLPIIRACRSRPLLVCDWHNIESEVMERYGQYARSWAQKLYAYRTKHLIKNMERRLLRECDAHVVVSKLDESKLRTLAPEARVHTVENGVDVSKYSDCYQSRTPPSTAPTPTVRRDLVFVGSMDFHANIDGATYFCSQVWRQIHALTPELRLVLVGSNPAAEIRDLARLPGVIVTGTVDDVRPYYREALASIVPLRVGGGTRMKILESMAAGVPVISTSIGAEGLDAVSGVNILPADTPEQTIQTLMELCRSRERWHSISHAGRELARTRYDWSVIGSSLQQIHCALVQ